MKLRKTNAVFSLLTTLLLLSHAISLAAWMLSKGGIAKPGSFIPWALTAVAVLHALLSICLMISTNRGIKDRNGKKYLKMNLPTVIQRISGMLLILFTWLHIAGTVGIMQPPAAVHAIVPPLFFLLVMCHAAISTGKALITLGIGSARLVSRADIAIKMLCTATLIADVIGFYLFVC